MKKNLLIFLSFISLNAFSEVTYEEAVIENLQDMVSNVSDLETNVQLIHDNLNYYLFSEEYKHIISELANFFQYSDLFGPFTIGDMYQIMLDNSQSNSNSQYVLEMILNAFSSTNNSVDEINRRDQEFNDYLLYWFSNSLGPNVESSTVALESIESHMDTLKISVTQLGDKIDQIVVNGNNTSDDLQTIIAELQKLNGDSSGGSSQLPVTTVGFYELEEYGKDVNTKDLSLSSLTTSGEFNKDVYNLLIHLNELGSSQNNALISMLTNVQVIASSVGGTAEGEDKVEKDIEERGYKAEQANQELNSILSQSFESYFAPPRISDVFNGVTVSLSDTQLPSRITIIDTFHYESESFSAELNDIGFDVPNGLLDLAYYGRIVFGFLYWTAAVYIALFVFRLWIKLYTYVSGLLN